MVSFAEDIIDFLPIEQIKKKRCQALLAIGDFLLKKDNSEKSFLVLFQNNLEIRPGGGFIGSFAIVKTKNGKISSMETHDLSNFDASVFSNEEPPYPIGEIMGVSSWKMRDSNFSPDFAVNAQKAKEFYFLGSNDQQKLDGVFGITTNVLTSMLKITGPIEIEGYPGTYGSENAVLALEYQVEKAFEEQGIDRQERKSIMSGLAKEIETRMLALSWLQKLELAKILLSDLNQKDIQLNFYDQKLQQISEDALWAGRVDQNWNKDFLMIVDANVGAFKSDYWVKRSIEYSVDLSKEISTAKLKITYNHTAQQKDWMTRNYTDYLRVFVPENSVILEQNNFEISKTGTEFGKKYFGAIVRVPIGTEKTIEIKYSLPISIKEDYNLKVQKQAGLDMVPMTFKLTNIDGTQAGFSQKMKNDILYIGKK